MDARRFLVVCFSATRAAVRDSVFLTYSDNGIVASRLVFSFVTSLQTRKKMISRNAMSPMLATGTGTVLRFFR